MRWAFDTVWASCRTPVRTLARCPARAPPLLVQGQEANRQHQPGTHERAHAAGEPFERERLPEAAAVILTSDEFPRMVIERQRLTGTRRKSLPGSQSLAADHIISSRLCFPRPICSRLIAA